MPHRCGLQLRHGRGRGVRDRPLAARKATASATCAGTASRSRPDQKLRIAINNYRAGGSAGYAHVPRCEGRLAFREEIRDLMVRYYTERKTIPVEATGNWKLVK